VGLYHCLSVPVLAVDYSRGTKAPILDVLLGIHDDGAGLE
jgi:hypothetical protein